MNHQRASGGIICRCAVARLLKVPKPLVCVCILRPSRALSPLGPFPVDAPNKLNEQWSAHIPPDVSVNFLELKAPAELFERFDNFCKCDWTSACSGMWRRTQCAYRYFPLREMKRRNSHTNTPTGGIFFVKGLLKDELGAGKWHFNDHFRHFRLFIGHWRENTNCKMLIYVSMCKNNPCFVFQTFLSVKALHLICRFQDIHEYMLSLRIWSVVSGSRGKTVQRELYTPSYVNQCCYKALNSHR